MTTKSQQYWIDQGKRVLPGGGFGNFDPSIVISRGKGSRVWDEDDNEYIDYLIGSGPMLLGHGHPEVLEAVHAQLDKGMTFFANNAAGIELADKICKAVPCAEQLRYVSTGGEADMYAMRLARAFTGRDKIMKFEGGYHGMSAEAQMSLAPKKLIDFPVAVPDSAGILKSVRDEMLIAPFNDPQFARTLIDQYHDQIAAIIVEPLQRILPPAPGFLKMLRDECDKHGIVLIFDEVVTGFRFSYGGAQQFYGVTPDLCTLGKVIGGGLPSAAVVGSADIMAHFDKSKVGEEGFLMQLGTLSGNPVAAIAGLKTLEILRRPGSYERLFDNGKAVMSAFSTQLNAQGHAHEIVGHPTLFEVVFIDKEVVNYRDVIAADSAKSARFNASLRKKGLLKSPGKIYSILALTEADLEQTSAIICEAAQEI
ncbi:MAG: aminotransferase class III-fold pyridoxal phosphate-dependent enzyme [Gammaproteobacteria bacterium]|nr:aminotransferase class III-fold pyridoxal phosphate-dependent enzyme [Gammaproteobacteria bacterium]